MVKAKTVKARKRKTEDEAIVDLEPLEPKIVEKVETIEKTEMDVSQPKVWPVAPEFPPEINYYNAEKLEGFRRAYAAFKREYEEALKA